MAKELRVVRSTGDRDTPDSGELYGRDGEIRLFAGCLANPSPGKRILNVHGTGGVGKTSLLRTFGQLAERAGIPYLMLDSRLFAHTPAEFCLFLLRSMHYQMNRVGHAGDAEVLADTCREAISDKSSRGMFVLAIDTFEEIGEMEHWLRESFLERLPAGVLIVLSGRFALHTAWHASPAWQRTIHRLPLGDLDFDATRAYLQTCGIDEEETIRRIWMRTRGHPLSLALLASTSLASPGLETAADEEDDLFAHIVQTWLREVPDPDMRELVESAAVSRHFNQELLGRLTGKPVTTEQFRRLVSYSFFQRIDRGWLMHELLRESIASDLRMRMPDTYNRLWRRCMQYYSNKLKQSARKKSVSWENADFLYYIGNQFIHFLLYRQWVSYSVEPLSPANREEADRYMELRRRTAKDGLIRFVNQDGTPAEYLLTRARELAGVAGQIRLQELYDLESGCVKLIRGGEGDICGLIEIIPIHAGTMDYLRSAPLSRAYFNALSEETRQELSVEAPGKSGYFVKTLDVYDFADFAMMHASLSTLISHILSTGYIVASPIGNPISKAICSNLGLEEAENVRNSDYDGVTAAAYYVLDTRGNNVQHYVDKMIKSLGLQENLEEEQPSAAAALSRREREVAERVTLGRSNLEIASDLCLSEVTVKKHLANIFRKLDVKSRSQLIHKLSDRM